MKKLLLLALFAQFSFGQIRWADTTLTVSGTHYQAIGDIVDTLNETYVFSYLNRGNWEWYSFEDCDNTGETLYVYYVMSPQRWSQASPSRSERCLTMDCYGLFGNQLNYDNNSGYAEITRETSDSLYYSVVSSNNGVLTTQNKVLSNIGNNIRDRTINDDSNNQFVDYIPVDRDVSFCGCEDFSINRVTVDDHSSVRLDRVYRVGDTIQLRRGIRYSLRAELSLHHGYFSETRVDRRRISYPNYLAPYSGNEYAVFSEEIWNDEDRTHTVLFGQRCPLQYQEWVIRYIDQ